jgi:uncharacterized protein (TIGR04255 family)
MGQPFPKFADPPVIETALGVEFAPLSKWGIPHFGLFWHEIRGEYPRFEVQPALVPLLERFGKPDKLLPQFAVHFADQVPVRCWFIHQSGTRLLQIQHDRFIHNWRKSGNADSYPHYDAIRPLFFQEWRRFREFLAAEEIGTPEVHQCEVVYVNHLDPGKGWQTPADLAEVLGTRVGAGTDMFLPPPETAGLTASYCLPAELGRLHVQLQHIIRHADAAETLQLTLTARGRPASSHTEDLLKWFDLGREWVVRGFADFTTARMHTLWQRKT